MSRWWCCCTGCWTSADNFNRPDSTNLGPRWTEPASSDAEISSNKLKITDGKVIYKPKLADPWGGVLARVDLVDMQDGDIFGVIVDYQPPPQESYYLCQIQVLSTRCILEILRYANGTYSTVESTDPGPDPDCPDLWCEQPNVTPGDTRQFNVYWAPKPNEEDTMAGGLLKAWLGYTDDAPYPVWTCAPASKGGKAGLIHAGGTRPLVYDNWSLIDHCEHNSACPCVQCTCDGHCLDQLYLTISYSGTGCPKLFPSGKTVALNRMGNRFVWISEPIICDPPGEQPPKQYVVFRFECMNLGVGPCFCQDERTIYTLEIMWMNETDYQNNPCGGAPNYYPSSPEHESTQCNPLSVVFTWTSTDDAFLACCQDPTQPWDPEEWTMTVTK